MEFWQKAKKKPVEIEVRLTTSDDEEMIRRKEGSEIFEKLGVNEDESVWPYYYIIRGVKGEIYPIEKNIFRETYEW